MICKFFSHSVGCHFILLMLSFGVQKFIYFYFCFSCLRRHIQKNIAKTDVKKCTAYFLGSFVFLAMQLVGF